MNRTAEVVIVGGGINGVALAWELARRGQRGIVLVERDHLAAGPTGRSGAVIRCHYSTPELVRLAMEGREFFRHATDLIGDDCGFHPVGFLAAVGPNEVPALEAKVAMQRAAGLDVDILRGADIGAVMPEFERGEIGAAAWEADSGHADAVRTTWALGRRAEALGVEIKLGCAVRDIRVVSGRVSAVETDDGVLATRRVVCATGPWTRQLIARLGHDLPTTILRNTMALFLRPPAYQRPHPVLIDTQRRFYARPDGRLTLTGSVDEGENQVVADPDVYDRGIHNEEIALFGARLGRAVRPMRGAAERGGWVGLYDVSPDWQHLIDELPGAEGLFILCGTSGHGFKLAPAVARITADLVMRGSAGTPEAAMFRLARLASGPTGFGVLA